MNREEFEQILKQWFPWIKPGVFELFEKYKNFLRTYNQHTNLTRLDEEEKIYQDYFLASLEPFKDLTFFTENLEGNLLDIGSGSGIPGVLLKIIFPYLKVSLLDSNQKKTDFLKALIDHLGITDCEVIHARAETYAFLKNETYDFVTSRAVSELRKILELSVRFVKVNGYIIQPKGINGLEELKAAQNAIKTLDLELIEQKQTIFYNYTHYLFVFRKLKSTKEEFPRDWKLILKDPL